MEFSPAVQRIGHGDNWHATWARDDNQYLAWGDGRGFAPATSPTANNGVAVLQGTPQRPRGSNLANYPFVAESMQHWYAYAPLAVDGALYVFVSYLEHGADRVPGAKKPTRFIGARLVWSDDLGKSWKMGDGAPLAWDAPTGENMFFWHEPGDAFSLLSALQQGRDSALARDGYVYFYAPGGWDDRMRDLMLARVPKARIRERAAWQFFAGLDEQGDAHWSNEIAGRRPAHRFPDGWVASSLAYSWHPYVVYDAPLGLYLMVASGNGRERSAVFSKPSSLGVYTAPNPWGPWTEIHWNDAWTGDDPGNRLYEPVIPPKWISPDGKSMYLIYSDSRDGYTKNYKVNLQEITLKFE